MQFPIDTHSNGVYIVDNLKFVNKFDALSLASKLNKDVYWNFNDAVFSSFDWTVPIEWSLPELYKQRAHQLRDSYDYLSLFFSGGVDSTNALHSFIDNNIFLDEIVMIRPYSSIKYANKLDKTGGNLWSEIEFAAIPYLKKQNINPKTLIRIIDMEESITTFSSNSNLIQQWNQLNYITPNFFAKNAICFNDKHWNALYTSGKTVGHITGTDKPIINVKNNNYSFQFNDVSVTIFHFDPTSSAAESEMIRKHQRHECFYWTPNFPTLVIKQCQVIKQLCETDIIFKLLFSGKTRIQHEYAPINHYIYSPQVNSIRTLFAADKAPLSPNERHQRWIDNCPSKVLGLFKDVVNYSTQHISDRFFTTPTQNNAQKYKIFFSNIYKL